MLLLNKFCLLFLLISAPFLSTAFAGRRSNFVNRLAGGSVDATSQELSSNPSENEEIIFQERVLKANTKDYGKYDPAPALVKPPFKLIPN